ncbi:hypothetical protein GOP47_0028820 [Adiantum capillus-veneris]|nr:hypothetical protein GOP47_0028820 [Adiantum capillus-veneris]
MNLFIYIGANSQTFANTSVRINFVKNFPMAEVKSWAFSRDVLELGVSGAIFTLIYHAIYGHSQGMCWAEWCNFHSDLPCHLWAKHSGSHPPHSLVTSLVTLMFMMFIRPMKPVEDKHEKQNFYSFLYLSLLLAAFLTLAIVLENLLPLSSAVYKTMGAITVLLVISKIGVAIRAERSIVVQTQERERAGTML